MLISATGHAQTATDDSSKDSEIIVTGVFNAKKIEDAPIAITAITALEISQQVPVSAADLLKNVPGEFGISTLSSHPTMLTATIDGRGGTILQLTDSSGFGAKPTAFSQAMAVAANKSRCRSLAATVKGYDDTNPKLMSRTTATVKPSEAFQIFLTHNYLGKRAANRHNAWHMPGIHTVDLD